MHVSEIVTKCFFPKFKFGALDIFQGVHGVRKKSGKSILVREKSGNLEIFGKSQGKLGFRQVFKKMVRFLQFGQLKKWKYFSRNYLYRAPFSSYIIKKFRAMRAYKSISVLLLGL